MVWHHHPRSPMDGKLFKRVPWKAICGLRLYMFGNFLSFCQRELVMAFRHSLNRSARSLRMMFSICNWVKDDSVTKKQYHSPPPPPFSKLHVYERSILGSMTTGYISMARELLNSNQHGNMYYFSSCYHIAPCMHALVQPPSTHQSLG